jgi:hypothetical protein
MRIYWGENPYFPPLIKRAFFFSSETLLHGFSARLTIDGVIFSSLAREYMVTYAIESSLLRSVALSVTQKPIDINSLKEFF